MFRKMRGRRTLSPFPGRLVTINLSFDQELLTRYPFPGQVLQESDQVRRPRPAVPPPSWVCSLASLWQGGSCGRRWLNWNLYGSLERGGSNPFFCPFDAYNAPILVEALCCVPETPRREGRHPALWGLML